MAEIAATAVVHQRAELDRDVQVGPYAIIGSHVRIGSGTKVGPHAILDGHTVIGKDCKIFSHAVVGTEPQDLKYRGERSWLHIGDRTVIREFATLNPATKEGESTRVGNDCLLMNYSHVAHNCILEDRVILANSVNLAGHVEVGTHAVVGGVTPVHQFVRIGAHSMIGGGSRIPQDVAPFTRVAGNPPKVFGLNVVGLTRREFSTETIASLKHAYRILFREQLNIDEAAAKVEQEVNLTAEVRQLVTFLVTSERGVTR